MLNIQKYKYATKRLLNTLYSTPLRTMVFIATATITNFINEMIATSAKPTILEFATEVHKRFYPEQDIAFMNYFFELASQENEGKFVVPHQKLIEYGIATSAQSSDVEKRIKKLGLEEGSEYLLRHMSEQLPSGTKHKKVYMLTPEAFKNIDTTEIDFPEDLTDSDKEDETDRDYDSE